MRKLDKPAISMVSLPEINAALGNEVHRLGYARKMKGNKRRAEISYLMNWLALAYMELTEENRDAIAARGKELLGRHLASDMEIDVITGGASAPSTPAQGLAGKAWDEVLDPGREPDGDDPPPKLDARPARKPRVRAK